MVIAYREVIDKLCQVHADDVERCSEILEILAIEDAKCGGRVNSAMWRMLENLIAFDQQFKHYSAKLVSSADKMPSRPVTPLEQTMGLASVSPVGSSPRNGLSPESPHVLDEKLADELRTRLFFIPRGQKAFQDKMGTFAKPPRDGVIDGGCVSPISSIAAVTYAHKSHRILREYDEGLDDEGNSHSLVEIRNAVNTTIRHKMKVIVVDSHHDFVILHSVDGREIFDDYPYCKRSPRTFESFIAFGLSHKTDNGQHITHRSGRICSDSVDHRGRFLASSSIDGGDSGGPCYSADRALIGIMVASTTTDPRLRTEYNQESIEEEIVEASSHPADTWITCANLITEAHMEYQVKHGFIQARERREKPENLGEPKSKRRAIDTV